MPRHIYSIILFVIGLCLNQSYGQKLSLTDITTLCSKSNWDDVNQSLINKGWEFYDSKKGDSEHYDIITWSYNKSYNEDKANGWISLYTYEGIPAMIRYEVFNDDSYKLINNNLKSNGFQYQKSEILDKEVITYYESSSYYIEVSNAKRKSDNYYSESLTAYSFTAKKKGGIYDPDNGIKTEYYWGNQIKLVYTLKNGKLNGPYKKYYENGQLSLSGNMVNDKKEGFFTEYHENGNKFAEYTMKNDLGNGSAKFYYEDGKLRKSTTFVNDRETGTCITYHDNGKKDDEYIIFNDSLNGSYKSYDYDGYLTYEGFYHNGSSEGVHKNYIYMGSGYANDIKFTSYICIIKNYSNNQLHGPWINIIKSDDGKIDTLSYVNYAYGVKSGKFKEYSNGDTLEHGSYNNGLLDGYYKREIKQKYYLGEDHSEGTFWSLDCIGFYLNGKKYSTWTYYNILGDTLLIGKYNNDQKTGKWTKYIPWGYHASKVEYVYEYKNGVRDGKCESFFYFDEDSLVYKKEYFLETYKNGQLDGEFLIKDSTGTIRIHGQFLSDKKTGSWIIGSKENGTDGKPFQIVEGNFQNDKREGWWTTTIGGTVAQKNYYANGLLEGKSMYYNLFGTLIRSANFKGGKFIDVAEFNDSGTDTIVKFKSQNITNFNFECTKQNFYSDSTTFYTYRFSIPIDSVNIHDLEFIVKNETYVILFGYFEIKDKNGLVTSKGKLYGSKLIDDCFTYYHDQKLYVKRNYNFGELENEEFFSLDNKPFSGILKVAKNGIIVEKIKVTKSKRNGPSLYLDSNGKVFRKEIYKDGQLVIK